MHKYKTNQCEARFPRAKIVMKETDYGLIQQAIQQELSETEYYAAQWLTADQLTAIVANIYINMDGSKEVSNHISDVCTIIATSRRVSLITEDTSTYWKSTVDICLYEDLTADIINILQFIDACFIRIDN